MIIIGSIQSNLQIFRACLAYNYTLISPWIAKTSRFLGVRSEDSSNIIYAHNLTSKTTSTARMKKYNYGDCVRINWQSICKTLPKFMWPTTFCFSKLREEWYPSTFLINPKFLLLFSPKFLMCASRWQSAAAFHCGN